MKKLKVIFCTIGLTALSVMTFAQVEKTHAPPMGFNSWDSYGMYPTQEAMLKNVEVMAERLKPFGYSYFVIDAGWNKIKNDEGQIIGMSIDKFGRYIPNKETFQEGIKAVADHAHKLGLKFGIHIMRGISRDAYMKDLPVYGTEYTARDITDTTSTCRWNKDNYGIDMSKSGAQEFYNSYISLLVNWGVDFIKADDIAGYPDEINAVVNAINKTGKKVVLSLSPGGDAKPEYFNTYKKVSMLRVTKDIWDNQMGIDRVFDAWKDWTNVDHEGFWLDMDMIPFGHLNLHNPDPDYLTAKENPKRRAINQNSHMSFFTKDQKYTFMALRALTASPLFMGGDLPSSDEFSFELLTNIDMLACNQNGVAGKLIYEKDGIEIWKTPYKNNPNQGWIGIFNRNDHSKSVQLANSDMGATGVILNLWDIWYNKSYGNITLIVPLTTEINANGVVFCKYKFL
jgi:Melibiase